MKTWKPDTCGCVIEEIYNGTEIVGGGQVVKKCSDHSTVADNELYGVLYSNPNGENKMKNNVLRLLLGYESVKDLGLETTKTNPDGSQYKDLKDGVEYQWSFTGSGKDRKLSVNIAGTNLTKSTKDKIRDYCNTKFGSGKVEVV